MTKVVIYSKPGCHLCEEAIAAIQAAGCEGEYTLAEVNIETNPDLLRLYRYEIPVITFDGVEVFRHRLSSEDFRDALRQVKAE
jgi:glutaredoxin